MSSPPPSASAPTLCAIGNFDGLHRGHVAVLTQAAREAAEAGLAPTMLTFDPPPAVVLGRKVPAALTPLERKIELARRAVPALRVVVERFDRALSESTPEAFARAVLVDKLFARRVVVGQNFRFGRGRAGDLATLVALGGELGFTARAAELVGDTRGPFSSTRARDAIAAGDLPEIEAVLGRPHALTGTVVRGDQRGRTIGFPTANVGDVEELLPRFGVYAVLVDRLDRPRAARAFARGVANIGVRPTVGGGPSTEVHLLDFEPESEAERDLYGARLRVHLIAYLRGEQKFDGLDALKRQIVLDAGAARGLTSERKPVPESGGGWY